MIMFPPLIVLFIVGILVGSIISIIFVFEERSIKTKIGMFLIPITLIGWLVAIGYSTFPETPKELIKEHKIVITEENNQKVARAIGSNVNFNQVLGANLKDGDIIREYKVGWYMHYGIIWIPEEDPIFELVNDK